MEVVWLRRAQQHLADIITYIADDNPTAAISVRQRIEEAGSIPVGTSRNGAAGTHRRHP